MSRLLSNVPSIRDLALEPFPIKPIKDASVFRESGRNHIVAVVRKGDRVRIYSNQVQKRAAYMPGRSFAIEILKPLVVLGVVSQKDYESHVAWATRSEKNWQRKSNLKRLQTLLADLDMKASPAQARAMKNEEERQKRRVAKHAGT